MSGRKRFLYLTVVIITLLVYVVLYQNSVSLLPAAKLRSNNIDEAFLIQLQTIPFEFINANHKFLEKHSDCGSFPDIYTLDYHNIYWQSLTTNNAHTYHIFGAYYDDRDAKTVRALVMHNRNTVKIDLYCQVWYANASSPYVVQVNDTKYLWRHFWGEIADFVYEPYLLGCELPDDERIPSAVSLVENKCDKARNVFNVFNRRLENQHEFGVCVKGLIQPNDNSLRLIEWIEVLRLLGASKIHFYVYSVHPNTRRVLDYYARRNIIEVNGLTLAGGPNIPDLQRNFSKYRMGNKRLEEMIPYNDCFYKNMYNYKYITLLDIDEIIMPKLVRTWSELNMSDIAFNYFRHSYFFDRYSKDMGLPQMHMYEHVYRAKLYNGQTQYVKGFLRTDRVLSLHNHFPFDCIDTCTHKEINTTDGQLQHYRTNCHNELAKDCDKYEEHVLDATIWRYADPLISRINDVINELGLS